MRLRVFGQHTIARELGFFLGKPRTATLIVEQGAMVSTISRSAFDWLSAERPELALLNYLVRLKVERLSFTS